MPHVTIHKERDAYPHHMLMNIASCALADGRAKHEGWRNELLVCITFSAFAMEAMANGFGMALIPNWEDFDKAPAIAKIRVISEKLGIEYEPAHPQWDAVTWMFGFRNRIAHARPQKAIKETVQRNREEYQRIMQEPPMSKIEKEITLGNAERCYKSVSDIFDLWCHHLPMANQDLGVIADGCRSQGPVDSPGRKRGERFSAPAVLGQGSGARSPRICPWRILCLPTSKLVLGAR